jgi:type II secretory pathway pseudopilin PulG
MRSNQAQSLVETIVAVGIIMVGVVGTLTLAFSSVRAGTESEARVLAVNLAREGIEVVKNIRDSNWLKIEEGNFSATCADEGPCWDQFTHGGPDNTNDYTCIAIFNGQTWSLNCDPDNWGQNCNGHDCTQVFQYVDGNSTYFTQTAGAIDEKYQATLYKRLIKTNEICSDDSIEEDGASCSVKIGIQIISEVRWFEGDKEKSIILEDRIYNWKMEALDDSWH